MFTFPGACHFLLNTTNANFVKSVDKLFSDLCFPPKTIKKSLIFGFIHGVRHIIHRKKTLITHYFYGNHRKYVLAKNTEKEQKLLIFNSQTPLCGLSQ